MVLCGSESVFEIVGDDPWALGNKVEAGDMRFYVSQRFVMAAVRFLCLMAQESSGASQ
jgi:hypothetical protein